MANAKGNAIEAALARCECEKQKRKKPPGDLTRCSEQMARATRYLKINFELGKFSDEARLEVNKVGDEAYTKCISSLPPN